MSTDKNTAIKQLGNNSTVAHQQSLVQKLAGPKINKSIKHIIPGGASLTDLVSRENLPEAIFTWLRRCRHFKDVVISFADNYSTKTLHKSHVVDFDTNTKLPQWEIQGKKWLAERISEVLAMDHIVAVKITKQGIEAMIDPDQTFSSESEDWLPQIIFTPNKPTGF
jgi:hypothetical protein